ncbi:MAG: AAA family ATPase [Lachnospiraceae bacterium]|nr:AAA family ATPase [Lachnospiraceae bacterium]
MNILLIFDEIQSAPKVVESLKYFCEDAGELAVIAAGSLLAMGEEKLAGYCKDYGKPETSEFSEKFIGLLKEYYCVGGMPEVVDRYVKNRDLNEVRELQNSIVHQYEGDFGKHINPNELPQIRMVWNNIPMQLAKENKKFFFGQIKQGGKSEIFCG